MEHWLNCLRDSKKSCFVSGGRKKIHYELADGREMAEEYNLDTNIITKRAWKKVKALGGEATWEIEVGDPSLPTSVFDSSAIEPSSSEPIMSTRITRVCYEWRIRNLPYPVETYSVVADVDQRYIVVKTTNKKFFKKIYIPEFDRLKLPVEQARITVSHKYNTLIISYKKPPEMITFEKLLLEELNKIDAPKEDPLQCPTS